MVVIGDVLEAVRHARCIKRQIAEATAMDETQRRAYAEELRVPYSLLNDTVTQGRLTVVNFAAGGIGRDHGITTLSLLYSFLSTRVRTLTCYTRQRTDKHVFYMYALPFSLSFPPSWTLSSKEMLAHTDTERHAPAYPCISSSIGTGKQH